MKDSPMKNDKKTKSYIIEGREILAASKTQARDIYQTQVHAAFAALDRNPQIITIRLSDGDHTLIITPGLDTTQTTTIHPDSAHTVTRRPNTILSTTKHSTPTANFLNGLYQTIAHKHLPTAALSIDSYMAAIDHDLTSLRKQAIQALRDTAYGNNREENAVQHIEESAIINALTEYYLGLQNLTLHSASISQISEQDDRARKTYSEFRNRHAATLQLQAA